MRAVIPALVLMLVLLWGQGQNVNAASGSVMINGTSYALNSDYDRKSSEGWKWEASSNTLTFYANYAGNMIRIICDGSDTLKLVYSGNVTVLGSLDSSLTLS